MKIRFIKVVLIIIYIYNLNILSACNISSQSATSNDGANRTSSQQAEHDRIASEDTRMAAEPQVPEHLFPNESIEETIPSHLQLLNSIEAPSFNTRGEILFKNDIDIQQDPTLCLNIRTTFHDNSDEICRNFFNTAGVQPWTQNEIERVTAILTEARTRIPHFMEFIESHGNLRLYRTRNLVDWSSSSHSFSTTPGNAAAYPSLNLILLKDSSFIRDDRIEEYIQTTPLSHVLIHELAHLFDLNRVPIFSSSPEFLNLSHWNNGTLQLPTLYRISLHANLTWMYYYYIRNDYLNYIRATHEFGRNHRYPSSYAMTNRLEAFAEFTAWIYHDRHANEYLETEMVQYINTHVLF